MYFVGFVILIGGVLAALWKLGILDSIGTTWTVIGVVIAIGLGIASSRDGSRLVPTRELNHGFSGKDATQAE